MIIDNDINHLFHILSAGFTADFLTDTRWWMLAACLSVPHWLYAFIWTHPQQFKALVGKGPRHPVHVFAGIAGAIKVFQLTTFAIWYLNISVPEFSALSNLQLIVGFTFGVTGQVLNLSMVKAIGLEGVYYGTRLGCDIPWCTTFPYSILSHPQYIGSVLSFWSLIEKTLQGFESVEDFVFCSAVRRDPTRYAVVASLS
ncbi:hypothetical protein CYMTET_6137 [Cymbomonas tetramitiformis]|uniref:phosphatidyl-N-methylethanolamine N-methyltransferase n=1 Tax=Cymbomonas tetramitiformis TaxID=36881 RepID=A0AAE0GXR0_9CHLO|nr:hypothetical protein CYMTET_6137 [Cymbomonas tetramitiformis]